MSNAIEKVGAETLSNIILKGDLSGLRPEQKAEYYVSVCNRLSLDPATQPFQLLNLSGKQVLYCSKAGAEQLTKKYQISHEIKDRQTVNDVFIVYVRATLPDGRFTDSSGAVNITGQKGDALANSLMKAETKAKRRSTISLLGLGMLDETEIETIPNAEKIDLPKAVPVPKVPETKEPLRFADAEAVDKILANDVFDPCTEKVAFGKYAKDNIFWIDLPLDYLSYLVKSEKTGVEAKNKAQATLDIQNATIK